MSNEIVNKIIEKEKERAIYMFKEVKQIGEWLLVKPRSDQNYLGERIFVVQKEDENEEYEINVIQVSEVLFKDGTIRCDITFFTFDLKFIGKFSIHPIDDSNLTISYLNSSLFEKIIEANLDLASKVVSTYDLDYSCYYYGGSRFTKENLIKLLKIIGKNFNIENEIDKVLKKKLFVFEGEDALPKEIKMYRRDWMFRITYLNNNVLFNNL